MGNHAVVCARDDSQFMKYYVDSHPPLFCFVLHTYPGYYLSTLVIPYGLRMYQLIKDRGIIRNRCI